MQITSGNINNNDLLVWFNSLYYTYRESEYRDVLNFTDTSIVFSSASVHILDCAHVNPNLSKY